jgi:kynurenine formamidase
MTAVPGWVQRLADAHEDPDHGPDCPGTLRYITPQVRQRGVASVSRGEVVSLSRQVNPGTSVRADESRPTFTMQTFAIESLSGHTVGSDRMELDCHGMSNTHLDGLTHVGLGKRWHSGLSSESATGSESSLLIGSAAGIATRAVVLDLAAVRGNGWVDPAPINGDDLDAAVRATGVVLESGDAVLLYMGRDRYEDTGHRYGTIREHPNGRAGVGVSGAEWLADQRVSVVGWDFLDSHYEGQDVLPVHCVAWAVGLVLIDNCHLGPAVRALAAAGTSTGLLTVAPLKISGATGCVVNPLLLY